MPLDGKKMIFDRIQITENHFGDLCSELSSFTKKKARLRDKYDELARIFKAYADTTRFNETLFNGLLNCSKSCTFLADIKDVEVQRLQAKTLRDLASYEHVCKNAREALKHSLLAQGKERLKTKTQKQNSIVEKHSIADSIEESHFSDFEANLLKFERKRITDIRQILMDFTLIQMKESVKNIEILTSMYNGITAIDVNKDLEEFEEKFLNIGSNSLKLTNRSQSMSAITNNLQQLKRTTMSNSSMSLDSPNKDASLRDRNKVNGLESEEEDDEDEEDEETTKSTEGSSDSDDEEESRSSGQTKQSTENQSSHLEDEDDDNAVQVRTIAEISKKKPETKPEPMKRGAPVPQVRFSKLVNHMKK